MAYISISPNRDAGRDNCFRVNGSDPVRIYTTAIHRLPDDEYTVVIRSANGECWECEGDLNTRRACSMCMNIRVAVDAQGNIVDVEYAVFPLNTQQEGAYMFSSSKLKLTFTEKAAAAARARVEESLKEPEDLEEEPEDFDEEELEAFEEELEEIQEEEELPPAPPSAPPVEEEDSAKKGGVGWIIFCIICLLTAIVNIGKIPTVIGCGVLGVICLLVGIKKKKG